MPGDANTFRFVFYFVKLTQHFTFIVCEFNHLNIFFSFVTERYQRFFYVSFGLFDFIVGFVFF